MESLAEPGTRAHLVLSAGAGVSLILAVAIPDLVRPVGVIHAAVPHEIVTRTQVGKGFHLVCFPAVKKLKSVKYSNTAVVQKKKSSDMVNIQTC